MSCKPFSALLLVQELFFQGAPTIGIRVGDVIPSVALSRPDIAKCNLVKVIKRHLYRVGSDKSGIFVTEKAVAHSQFRQQIKTDLKRAQLLGRTLIQAVHGALNMTIRTIRLANIGKPPSFARGCRLTFMFGQKPV